MRLDLLLVQRSLASSRARARALILAGRVHVDGQPRPKAGGLVSADATIALAAADHPYVGRGGVKLAHALDAFGIVVEGRRALDIGASTGGFTDALLQRGARAVVALDVGHGQLDWKLRNDPRVTVLEGVNARHLERSAVGAPVDLVTIDVSFISLRQILPAVAPLLAPGADLVALVKPQFEAGRREVGRKGIIKDPRVQARVVDEVSAAAEATGLVENGRAESPITGAEGNREFFLHLRQAAPAGKPVVE
jgi:23S rRNA (cytidine1920-2'-O)/16S rRNA (cytidine1409-2'-O)-methyltransferase